MRSPAHPFRLLMLSQPCGTFFGVLVLAASTWQQAHAATITFDWNTGPGDGTVPDRYSSDIVATVGDELVLSWQDPTTTPSGTMFHEVVPMADNSCTFATGYAIATGIDVTNGGVKAAISSTIALDTVRRSVTPPQASRRYIFLTQMLRMAGRDLLFLVRCRLCGLVRHEHQHCANGDWRLWLHWRTSLGSLRNNV